MPAVFAASRAAKELARDLTGFALARAGFADPESRLCRDAQDVWHRGSQDEQWRDQSHWRSGGGLGEEVWASIGRDHLAMFRNLAAAAGVDPDPRRVVEWGCGGGANAVAFAPSAREFVGVDVSAESLAECARQVGLVCPTPFQPVLATVADPEAAARSIGGGCNLFLCLYVLELVPNQAYGLRILRIAHDLLADDGVALVQIKYRTSSWRTQPRRRGYRQSVLAGMTTYRIEEFWTAALDCGLQPRVLTLVPENRLDRRYAYFLLAKR